MSGYFAALLAQAAPTEINATPGQAIAGLIALLMVAVSLAMGVIWVTRWLRDGHALPLASRGVLRCPPAAAAAAIVLSALLAIMAIAGSMSPEPDIVPLPETLTETVSDVPLAGGAPSQSSSEESAAGEAPAPAAPDPDAAGRVNTAITTTLVFDLMMLAGFGFVVWYNRIGGPAPLPSTAGTTIAVAVDADAAQEPAALRSYGIGSRWPDLDVAVPEPDPGNTETPGDDVPIAAVVEDIAETEKTGALTEEPVRFGQELMYAAEVFAVALLPTMLLRLLMVFLYTGLGGSDEIPQHPFLQLMEQGVGAGTLVLIALLAVVMAPLTEELVYRVVILGGMAQSGYVGAGVITASILFCLAHGFPDCIALLPLSLLLAYAWLRRRSYVTVILVHFLFNAFNLVVAGIGMF